MKEFNLAYALSLPAVAGAAAGIAKGRPASALSDGEADAVLDLVVGDDFGWGSAAWFYNTQCGDDVHAALKAGGREGWEKYLGCVGVAATAERDAYWERANTAFGLV